jgi:hypothetical protein
MYKRTNAGADVVEKFRKVRDSVWVCLKAVITEKTLKEESSKKNYFYDNYSYYSDTIYYIFNF